MVTLIKPIFPHPIKLKIHLENMPHNVYRIILVPENINMLQLHSVIQVAMGWEFAHLFQFSDKKLKPTLVANLHGEDPDSDLGFGFGSVEEIKAHKVFLKNEFLEDRSAAAFWYWYDFGDDWWHKITFQKVNKKDLRVFKSEPICVDAFGACPPEDVGGPWGYADFCEAISNKKHPDYKELREWMGMNLREKYDFESVDVEYINKTLSDFFQSEEWNRINNDYL